jgi:hypothetical protein
VSSLPVGDGIAQSINFRGLCQRGGDQGIQGTSRLTAVPSANKVGTYSRTLSMVMKLGHELESIRVQSLRPASVKGVVGTCQSNQCPFGSCLSTVIGSRLGIMTKREKTNQNWSLVSLPQFCWEDFELDWKGPLSGTGLHRPAKPHPKDHNSGIWM